jgi:hypothetical protein
MGLRGFPNPWQKEQEIVTWDHPTLVMVWLFDQKLNEHYGNMGCRVFKWKFGKIVCLQIYIPKGNY